MVLLDINQYVIHRDPGGYFRLRALIENADGSVAVSAKPPNFPHVTPSHPHQQQHPLSASGVTVSGDPFSAGALSHSGRIPGSTFLVYWLTQESIPCPSLQRKSILLDPRASNLSSRMQR